MDRVNLTDRNHAALSLANRCDPDNTREAEFAETLRKSIAFSEAWREMEVSEKIQASLREVAQIMRWVNGRNL